MKRFTLLMLVMSITLLASCGQLAFPRSKAEATPTPMPTPVLEPTAVPALTLAEIAKQLGPSTVLIRASFPETIFYAEGEGSGTGVVISADGYILTNAHVVEGASAVTVALPGSTKEYAARIVGVSTCDDLAVLKVDNPAGLQPAALGSSRDLQVGEEVVALGYPLGAAFGIDITVTPGSVSKKDVAIAPYESLIQTAFTSNHGNSGGPLVNQHGEVVGINTLRIDSETASNTAFAIAIDQARTVVAELQKGHNRHWVGANVRPVQFKDGSQLLVVDAVESGSPAAHIGIMPGDVLYQVEDLEVPSAATLCKILRSHGDGDNLRITVARFTDSEVLRLAGELVIGVPDGGQQLAVVAQRLLAEESVFARAGAVSYSFDGETDSAAWYTGSTDWHAVVIADGFYQIALLQPQVYFITPDQTLVAVADMEMQADVYPVGNVRAGVAVRYQAQGAGRSYYTCWIDGGNRYGCFVSVNNQWTPLVEGNSAAILPGQVNHLTLEASGREIAFAVNSTVIAQFTDARLATGVAAIYLANFDDRAGAAFDNIAFSPV